MRLECESRLISTTRSEADLSSHYPLRSSILLSRSPIYLQALNTHYFTASRKHLTKEIKQHFSGHLQAALLHAVNGGKKDGTGVWRDAKLLERSMAGMGTKDEQL